VIRRFAFSLIRWFADCWPADLYFRRGRHVLAHIIQGWKCESWAATAHRFGWGWNPQPDTGQARWSALFRELASANLTCQTRNSCRGGLRATWSLRYLFWSVKSAAIR